MTLRLLRTLDRSSRTHAPRRHARSDRGDTLIEVLIALVVLGVASAALLLGFDTSIFGSSVYRSVATMDTVLRTAVEEATTQIQQNATTAFACSGFQPTFSLPSGYAVSSYSATFWNSSQGQFVSTPCTAGQPQLLAITVTHNGSTSSISTIAEDPLAPAITTGTTATQLVFIQQPQNVVAGSVFSSAPEVAIEDANNHFVTNDLSQVALSLTVLTGQSGTTLSSLCSGQWTPGVFTFQNCSIASVGQYELKATDTGETNASGQQVTLTQTSNSFNVTTGPVSASQSTVSASPTVIDANGSTSSTVTISLEDAEGNPITTPKTVTLSASGGSSTFNTSATTNSNGVATFSVTDTTAESVTYTATETTDPVPVTLSSTPMIIFTTGPSASITYPMPSTIYSTSGTNVWSGTISGTTTSSSSPGVGTTLIEIYATTGSHAGTYWNGVANGGAGGWQTAVAWNAASGTTTWSYGFYQAANPPTNGIYTITAKSEDSVGYAGPSVSVSTQFASTAPTVSAPIVNGYP